MRTYATQRSYNGNIAHFNPASQQQMMNPAIHGTRFNPGAVTISNLKEVVQYEIGVDNKTYFGKSHRARPVSELVSLIELLAYKPGFEYSLFYFNCEQFAV